SIGSSWSFPPQIYTARGWRERARFALFVAARSGQESVTHSTPENSMRTNALATLLLLSLTGAPMAMAAQAAPGIAPVRLTQDVYHFDSAEQHGIRVDVLVRGLNHPFSLALLPEG